MFLILTILTGVIFVFLLLFRFHKRMAALVAWIIGTFVGNSTQEQTTTPSSVSQKSRQNQKLKESEDSISNKDFLEIPGQQTNRKKSSTKYQAVVQETRKKSLNFDNLIDKLTLVAEENSTEGLKNTTKKEVGNSNSNNQQKRKKRSPKKSSPNEDRNSARNSSERVKESVSELRTQNKKETFEITDKREDTLEPQVKQVKQFSQKQQKHESVEKKPPESKKDLFKLDTNVEVAKKVIRSNLQKQKEPVKHKSFSSDELLKRNLDSRSLEQNKEEGLPKIQTLGNLYKKEGSSDIKTNFPEGKKFHEQPEKLQNGKGSSHKLVKAASWTKADIPRSTVRSGALTFKEALLGQTSQSEEEALQTEEVVSQTVDAISSTAFEVAPLPEEIKTSLVSETTTLFSAEPLLKTISSTETEIETISLVKQRESEQRHSERIAEEPFNPSKTFEELTANFLATFGLSPERHEIAKVDECSKFEENKENVAEVSGTKQIQQKENKVILENLPQSSIIEHYKVKNKSADKSVCSEVFSIKQSESFNQDIRFSSNEANLEDHFVTTQEGPSINNSIDKVEQNKISTDLLSFSNTESLSVQKYKTSAETKVETNVHLEQEHLYQKLNVQTNSPSFFKKSNTVLDSLNTQTNIPTMKITTQVRVLTLNDNERQDCTLYRLEKNWNLEFRLGPSLFGRKVSLYCNYPETKEGKMLEFNRDRYYLLPWKQDEGCQSADDTSLFAKLTVKVAGSFHYYFIYDNATESGPHGSGYFLVDPTLKYGANEELPLNCIQCQTVLSKLLGPFSTWESKLRVAKESGYNMVHFTPVQELGKSNSAYSLKAQLTVNPTFNDGNTKTTFNDIEKLTNKMRNEWKVLSICDIVLNHTANETDWLQEHPEATYNCLNCPYMRPAYLLDAALQQFSEDVKNGIFESWGVPIKICTEDHLNAIRHALYTKVLPDINIPEMFICDVNKLVGEFFELARKTPAKENSNVEHELKLIRDPMYRRMATKVDMDLALKLYNVYRSDSFDEDTRVKRCVEEFKNRLDQLNKEINDQISTHLSAAVENSIAGMRYFRVQHDGPKVTEISLKNPLSFRYFTDFGNPKSVKEFEDIMYGPNSKYLMAHNGWVMNADPMKNFADIDSNVYIRRELIAWGDSVKLRFGDKPEDCPFLWNHMKLYVEQTAKVFDGVRLDNCHSTPLPVAEYLLDCARRVRPDLYVVAELFTNSDHTDNVFVNRLGISSLIREAMSAWDSHEEGRLVYRYGGDPVGAFFQPHFRPLVPSIAHALFLDLTHDNPSPVEKRSIFDLLPSCALVNMACCASGSNRGYDELVNHHIHVVDEDRQYTEWTTDEKLSNENPRYVSSKSGIIAAKKALNELHFKLGIEGFNQVYVDQMDPDIVAVTRHRPDTHQSVVLVAFTAFAHPNLDAANHQRGIKSLRVEGVLDEIVLEATLSHVDVKKGGSKYTHFANFTRDKKYINGVAEYQVNVKQHIQLEKSDVFELGNSGNPNVVQLNFKNFKPGSVVAIKVSLPKNVQQSINKLRDLMSSLARREIDELTNTINQLNLADLNRALYRCDQEEQDEGKGFGSYHIPNFGSLVYCGFQGFVSLLSTIRPSNDLGHPMCGNLRDGNWMIDYIYQRLKVDDGTKKLGQWIEKNIQLLKDIPRYMIPSYFDVIVTGIYMLLLDRAYHLMSEFVKHGSTFVKGLSLGSLQFAAVIKSADLPTLSPDLAPPKPPSRINEQGQSVQASVTLSAGLPHFSTGYMRNWGRDTFISLRGLFILTGRYQDARYHILGYAACLRHGLIPNLLDGGRNSRFNCRDAVWWWLYCIKSYVEEVPNGIDILSDKVSRIFPTDDSPAVKPGVVDQPLHEVIQEALKVHFQGLAFRERNAGTRIDAHMVDKGFNNQIGIHPETGFVFGGNDANCGTWMDKMGSSDKAHNRGKPATPRDGSAIELVGLSKAVVTWLDTLHKNKQYPYDGVERNNKSGTVIKWTFKQWADVIQNNFEKYFWVNTNPVQDEIRPDLINKRGIYKDSFGATQEWADFQLRCNFPIAMVAAPEMFDPKHAWVALQNVEKYLLGPLGMKTLDPDDWTYNGDYNNADDSDNPKLAHGFNYHQGPEWVWPVGYYLRAKLYFAVKNNELSKTVANIKVVLSKHFTELQTSVWRGLPELTNSNGSYCNDSSRTQAWSMSCILEVLHDLQQIESKLQTNALN